MNFDIIPTVLMFVLKVNDGQMIRLDEGGFLEAPICKHPESALTRFDSFMMIHSLLPTRRTMDSSAQ